MNGMGAPAGDGAQPSYKFFQVFNNKMLKTTFVQDRGIGSWSGNDPQASCRSQTSITTSTYGRGWFRFPSPTPPPRTLPPHNAGPLPNADVEPSPVTPPLAQDPVDPVTNVEIGPPLPIHGPNAEEVERFNMNRVLLANIQRNDFFKSLARFRTVDEIIDEVRRALADCGRSGAKLTLGGARTLLV